MRMLIAVTATCVAITASTVTIAAADVFNGRIAFSSFRAGPTARTGDIFTINEDGTGLRQLITIRPMMRSRIGRLTAGTSPIASASLIRASISRWPA